jgi:Predicted membrane protein
MNCPSCGTSNSDDAKSCDQCGDATHQKTSQPSDHSKFRRYSPILATVVLVIAIILAVVINRQGNIDKANSNSKQTTPQAVEEQSSSQANSEKLQTWTVVDTVDPMSDSKHVELITEGDMPLPGSYPTKPPILRVECFDGRVISIRLDSYVTLKDHWEQGEPAATTRVTYRFDHNSSALERWQDDHGRMWPRDKESFLVSLLQSENLLVGIDNYYIHSTSYILFHVSGLTAALDRRRSVCNAELHN